MTNLETKIENIVAEVGNPTFKSRGKIYDLYLDFVRNSNEPTLIQKVDAGYQTIHNILYGLCNISALYSNDPVGNSTQENLNARDIIRTMNRIRSEIQFYVMRYPNY